MRDGAASQATAEPSDGALDASKGGDGTGVSPSEVRQDFFHSSSPSSTQQQQESRDGQSALSADEPCHEDHSSGTSSSVAGQPTPKSISVTQFSRLRSVQSPRLSLSLKRGQTPGSGARRIILPAASAAEKKSHHGGFEMGLSPEEQLDSLQAYTSSPPMPQIEVPSDSQFENSDSSELYFKVTKPPSNRSFTSDQEDMDAEPAARGSKSLFSDVVTTKRQKVTSSHSKGVSAIAVPVTQPVNPTPMELEGADVSMQPPKVSSTTAQEPCHTSFAHAQNPGPTPTEHAGASSAPDPHCTNPTPNPGAPPASTSANQSPVLAGTVGTVQTIPDPQSTIPIPIPGAPPTSTSANHPPVLPSTVQTISDPHPTIPIYTPIPPTSTSANQSPMLARAVGSMPSASVTSSLVNPTTTQHGISKDTSPGISAKTILTDQAPEPSHPILMEQSAIGIKSTMPGTSVVLQPVLSTSRAADRSHMVMNLSADTVPSVRVMQSPVLSPHIPYASPVSPRRHLSSPFTSSSEFVSPSRSISAEGLLELRRQVSEQLGREVALCELRYVRTTRTVIEERSICCEMVDNGVVVPGSEKVLQVSNCMVSTRSVCSIVVCYSQCYI